MRQDDADRNLLFGFLALQLDFVSREHLLAALSAWVSDKTRDLGRIFAEQGALSADRHALLEALVNEHLRLHDDDARKSLAALSSLGEVRTDIVRIADPEMQASLAIVGVDRSAADPHATRAESVGASSSGARFQILRPHARGGLGEVFIARDQELHREVALKEIQGRHALEPESRVRFLLEAEITGGLEHPGIVPVYGLGQYADGRPFYAMRFIKGDSLKDAIERFHDDPSLRSDPGQRALHLRKLLARFLDVCNAVAYAHSRGVLHRDLKPGNIMVGKFGETLVVDWGLAKAQGRGPAESALDEQPLQPSSASGSAQTLPGRAIGTPGFMSPEQAAGRIDRLGPASDVYSLGATLFCLLTGRAPFSDPDVGRVLNRVQAGDFPRPRELDSTIAPGLEAICLKAMALEPVQRYQSPNELAEEIERWLADEPVAALPEAWPQRAGRWMRRHRSATRAGAAAVVVIAIVATASAVVVNQARTRERGALQQARLALGRVERALAAEARAKAEAETNFAQARQAVNDYFATVNKSVLLRRDLPGLQKFRAELLGKALPYYQRFIQQHGNDPALQVEVADAYNHIALVTSQIGSEAEALQAYERAKSLLEGLPEPKRQSAQTQLMLAKTYSNLGSLQSQQGHQAGAMRAYATAQKIRKALLSQIPDSLDLQDDLASTYNNLGVNQMRAGQYAEAQQNLSEAVRILNALVAKHPELTAQQDRLAKALISLGSLQEHLRRPQDAERSYRQVQAIAQGVLAREPGFAEAGADLAQSYNLLAELQRASGRSAEAERTLRQARQILEDLIAQNPDMIQFQSLLASTYLTLGNLNNDLHHPDAAEQSFKQARDLLQKLVQKNPEVTEYQHRLAQLCANLGIRQKQTGRLDEAEQSFATARQTLEDLVARDSRALNFLHDLATTYINLATLQQAQGHPADARQSEEKAQHALESLLARAPDRAPSQSLLGVLLNNQAFELKRQGQYEAAAKTYRKAVEHQHLALTHMPQVAAIRAYLGTQYEGLADVYRKLRKPAEAAAATRERLQLEPASPIVLYNAACAYSLCIPLVGTPGQTLSEAEVHEQETYAQAAMDALEQAVKAGFSDAQHMSLDPDLAPLHDRHDFRRLIASLRDRTFPAQPFAP